ncbi:hypothetical protein [Streptomyces sp. ISBFB 2968]
MRHHPTCRDSAARWQEITGTNRHTDEDMVAHYQRRLDEVNDELKNR